MNFVCILDYGSGNVRSVFNLFSAISHHVVISNDPANICKATHIVLPGVGAFKASMLKIRENLPMDVLEEVVLNQRKHFLGICVGMQVLADRGVEFGEYAGLGWIGGVVEKVQSEDLPLPHIGWNDVSRKCDSALFAGLGSEPDFYFVHSYAFRPQNDQHVLATTTYGEQFCSVVQHENVYGVQFHPEKSQRTGIRFAENFLSLR